MAFTTAEAVQIRKYLGVPSINRYRDPRLEGAIEVVGADTDAATEVRAILAAITNVETTLTSALSTAGLKRAEDIEWYQASSGSSGSSVVEAGRSEGRRLCAQLSVLFGVPLVNDAFGTGGYGGDWFMGTGFQYGGPIRLG